MKSADIFARLQTLVPDALIDHTEPAGAVRDPFARVKPDRWHEIACALRDDNELQMDFLQNVTAVDWPKKNVIEVVYHLYSYPLRHTFVVKADLPRERPAIPSVADLWAAADWNEREQFDLLGVGFTGHPDLRRVLMPDDWVGHPMRKDFKEAEAYRGMPTTRPSPLQLLVVYDKAPPDQKGMPGPAAAATQEGAADE